MVMAAASGMSDNLSDSSEADHSNDNNPEKKGIDYALFKKERLQDAQIHGKTHEQKFRQSEKHLQQEARQQKEIAETFQEVSRRIKQGDIQTLFDLQGFFWDRSTGIDRSPAFDCGGRTALHAGLNPEMLRQEQLERERQEQMNQELILFKKRKRNEPEF